MDVDPSRLVRRAPRLPQVRLGDSPLFEPLVQPRVGARFPAFPAKERDFALDPLAGGAPRRPE